MSLDEWKESGLQLIRALRVRGEEEAFRRLLSELYPDTAHFIYELLQNAEDTKAASVYFKLNAESLVFNHKGERLFTENDVKAITSFGNSTKRDDPTSIGKFGVGFKAVFAYTNTPEIYSGDFHFCIHDLVVPETKDVPRLSSAEQKTCFIFPFDHPKKSPETAVAEIQKGLCDLSDNTLLFLSHIRKIDYILPDGSFGSLERLEHSNGRIEIRASHPGGKDTVSHWLHFNKDVHVMDDDGKPKNCRVAIAYSLAEETNKKTMKRTWKIVPLSHGQVSIYFPAEKETSKLRFHLHAPFASTVARDSIRDCPANKQLRDHLARLIIESLKTIRGQGMLSMNFLAVLPNPKDNLSEFYEPIRKAIVEAFKNEPFTPTKSGSHAASNLLYRSPSRISEVISDKDLSVLTGRNIPLWVANAPQRNQREDSFLDSLKIDEWSFCELSDIFRPPKKEKTETWIAKKDDTWMMRFYTLLNDDSNCYKSWAENFPLVRVDSETGVNHVIGKQAYFAPLNGGISALSVHIVKRTVYKDENAQKFLRTIGVKPFDTKAVIEIRLNVYRSSPPKQLSDEYYEDIKNFVSYWKENALEGSWYRREVDELFKPVKFLLDENRYWRKALDICLDSPVTEIKTGLAELTEIHGKNPIWNGYLKKLSENERKDFVEFLQSLGAMHKLKVVEIERSEAINNPNNPYINEKWCSSDFARDYSIPDLGKYLIARNISASLIIWNIVINTSKDHASAQFQLKKRGTLKSVDSRLVYLLKKYPWIPDKSGGFYTPQKMTRESLHADFLFKDDNNLLTAIEFGKEQKERDEANRLKDIQASSDYKKNADIAKSNGFDSLEEMTAAAELVKEAKRQGKSVSDLKSDLSKTKQQKNPFLIHQQPEESVLNPERRRKGILERSENAPSKESVIRERSIQPGLEKNVAEAKAYLRTKYTNANWEMICQCCQKEMPFKINDAYYFEAVQCVKNTAKHHLENRLALCPICAAMYLHARATDDAEIHRLIVELEASDDASSIEIPVTLADQSRQLRFVGTHWFDLKTVLSSG